MSQTENQEKTAPERLQEAYVKAAAYCAYQDRCEREVVQKLHALGLEAQYHHRLLDQLREERYLDELRFAGSFARGRFYQKKWGKTKIYYELRQRGISLTHIDQALTEIDPQAYIETMQQLLQQKARQYRSGSPFELQQKLLRFMVGKGYDPDDVRPLIDELCR